MVRDTRATLDACLEHVHKLHLDRDAAQYSITRFLLAHPEYEADLNLTEARLALV